MDVSAQVGFDAHEKVVFFSDPQTGLEGVIVLHSTALGPAAGGCRMATYVSREAALTDALRLSQGMSYKNAMAGLPAGGGKAVLFRQRPDADRAAVFEAFGAAVEELGGAYITAEDVGTSVADMEFVARRTRFVAGLPHRGAQAGGDPSPWTAMGVFQAMKAARGKPLKGARVAVQGLGSVGMRLCRLMHADGARLVVADVDAVRTVEARREFGAEVVSVERIHQVEADVFSPNALGAVLNVDSIPELQAPLVCGGANNQLGCGEDGVELFRRGIMYVPDYVANAGGIINVMAEYLGESAASVESRVRAIGGRVGDILVQSKAEQRPPHEVADAMARARIGRQAEADAA